MRQEFSKWYRDKFSQLEEHPDNDVWKNINAQLDKAIPTVKTNRSKRKYFFLFVTVLLLLSSSGIVLFEIAQGGKSMRNRLALSVPTVSSFRFPSNPAQPNAKIALHQLHKQNLPPPNSTSKSTGKLKMITKESKSPSISIVSNPSPVDHPAEPPIFAGLFGSQQSSSPSSATNLYNDIAFQDSMPAEETAGKIDAADGYHFDSSMTVMDGISTAVPADSMDGQNQQQATAATNAEFSPRLYVGFCVKVGNTWLLNQQTYFGFSRNGFDRTHICFSSVAGVQIGYLFTPHFGLESHFYVHNYYTQKYSIYADGILHEEKTTFNGKSIDLCAKLGMGKNNGSGFYLQAGMQAMFIKKVTTKYEYSESNQADFTHIYPSAKIGIGYDFLPSNNWQLMVGMRSNIGLKNVYDDIVPFNKTVLADINVYVSINRIAWKKRKE